MLPPGYTEQHQKKKPEEDVKKDSQCLQTLICMLSCRDGYQLGKKGGDGCQTCKCVKKGETDRKCSCIKDIFHVITLSHIYIFIFTGDPNKSFLYIFSLTMKLFKISTDDKNKNNTSQTGQEKMNNENTTQNTGSGTPGGGSGAQGPFGGAAGSESGTSIKRCSLDLT